MGRGTRNLLLGCGLLIAVLCVCGIGVALLGSQFLGDALAFFSEAVQPYDIAGRPLPANAQANVILPPTVGAYSRLSYGPAAGGGLQAIYSGNDRQVFVTAVQYSSAGQAQARVAQISEETRGSAQMRTTVTGLDPSFVRAIAADGRARMAWSHGPFFFDVQTDSEAALDEFMTNFPY